jgi:hypothetical protein
MRQLAGRHIGGPKPTYGSNPARPPRPAIPLSLVVAWTNAVFEAGVVVLAIDLWLEGLPLGWKFMGWAVILSIAIAFLVAVVLRKNPLQIDYSISGTHEIDVVIHNGSDSDDYRDVDLTLGTDSDRAYSFSEAKFCTHTV